MANQEGLDTPLPRKNSDLSPRNNRLVITAPSSSSCNRTTKYILSFNARFERCAANKSRYIAARNNPSLDEEERERDGRESKGKEKKSASLSQWENRRSDDLRSGDIRLQQLIIRRRMRIQFLNDDGEGELCHFRQELISSRDLNRWQGGEENKAKDLLDGSERHGPISDYLSFLSWILLCSLLLHREKKLWDKLKFKHGWG